MRAAAFISAFLVGILGSAQMSFASAEYGAYLASTCRNCHHESGTLPAIESMTTAQFRLNITSFKSGERVSKVMKPIAQGLGPLEVDALVSYIKVRRQGVEK